MLCTDVVVVVVGISLTVVAISIYAVAAKYRIRARRRQQQRQQSIMRCISELGRHGIIVDRRLFSAKIDGVDQ